MSTDPSPIKGQSLAQNPLNTEQIPLNTQGGENKPILEEESILSIREAEEEEFCPYYIGEKTFFLFKIIFIEYFSYCLKLYVEVTRKGKRILSRHIPRYSINESIEPILRLAEEDYKRYPTQLTSLSVVKIIYGGVLRWTVLKIFFCYLIQALSKCSLSLLISAIITSVKEGDTSTAYKYAGVFVVLCFTGISGQHHGYTYSMIFSSQARLTLVNLVYQKLTELSSFAIKEANVGKILNLVSGDINSLEHLFITSFQLMVMPITLVYAGWILWARFTAVGLLAIAILLFAYPIQVTLQSLNSSSIRNAKSHGDHRLKLTNELIEGIRLIKMYAWEQAFKQMIFTARSEEFKQFFYSQCRTMLDRLFSLISQVWSSFFFFLAIYYGGVVEDLSVADMVATVQLLSYLKFTCIFMFSFAVQAIIMINISFGRIAQVLNISNIEMTKIDKHVSQPSQSAVELQNFYAYWQKKEECGQPTLKNLNIKIEHGELLGVIGKIGSGKSTLLNAFLSEIPAYKGSMWLFGTEPNQKSDVKIAYVEQEPFIFPDSIRKNVLFGRPYDKHLYKSVLHASCLEQDLVEMKFQDYTEIGERGVTLSGGQKARLSLARALYQMADIYLFDDPLSAVDANVARNIFHMAIREFIFTEQPLLQPDRKAPVAILVTHQVQYAIECDKIAIMSEGSIVEQGTYEDVKNSLNMISEEFAKQLQMDKEDKEKKVFKRPDRVQRKRMTVTEVHNLVGKEEDSTTSVTYRTYMRYFSYWFKPCLVMMPLLGIGAEAFNNIYLRYVSLYDEYAAEGKQDEIFLLMGMMVMGLFLNNAAKYFTNTINVQTSVQAIHQDMISKLIISPVSYYDTNPSGRIINRFSNDLAQGDMQSNVLLLDIQDILWNTLISLVTLAILVPYCAIFIGFVILADSCLYMICSHSISELKEIELQQRSPLFDFLKKTLGGVIQVRVYNQVEFFRKQFLQIANKCNICTLSYYYAMRAFGYYIDMVGYVVQVTGVFMLIQTTQNDVPTLSQAMLLITIFNDSLQWGLRQLVTFETQMNSYNRMFQIIDIKPEAPHTQPSDNSKEFPKDGQIHFNNVQMRYRQDLDLVLKGLTFEAKDGEKIGCVGRTGAGKSSILQVLFRMMEVEDQPTTQLLIGGEDIRNLGLTKLRKNIGIIPQSPFLFTGTIRRNLDPFSEYSDEQLWLALEQTDLKNHVKGLKKGLESDMSDVNSVFSVGQKQLICLARTLLNKKKIIVLDEATANVDMKTDDFIQQTLKEKFSDSTLITIAHRLNTIADYDKVMVVSEGKALEYDLPFNLLAHSGDSTQIDRDTQFAQLVKNTGPQNSMAIFNVAKQKYLSLSNKQ